jgi:hypothetical protein
VQAARAGRLHEGGQTELLEQLPKRPRAVALGRRHPRLESLVTFAYRLPLSLTSASQTAWSISDVAK